MADAVKLVCATTGVEVTVDPKDVESLGSAFVSAEAYEKAQKVKVEAPQVTIATPAPTEPEASDEDAPAEPAPKAAPAKRATKRPAAKAE